MNQTLYDTDLEERIIGTLLTSEDSLIELNQFLKPFHFNSPELSEVYSIMEGLYGANKGVNYQSVLSEAKRLKKTEIGILFITNVSQKHIPPSHLDNGAKLLVEYYMRRQIVSRLPEVSHRASDTRKDIFDVLNEADKVISDIRDNSDTNEDVHVKTALEAAEKIYQTAKKSDGFIGLESGIKELDRITCGFKKTDNIVLAGRSSMGKTALMLNIAKHNAVRNNVPTAIFSLEMSKDQLVLRMIADLAGVDFARLRQGRLSEMEEAKYDYARELIEKSPLYIDDTPTLDSDSLRSRVKKYKRKYGIELVMHDYIQLRKGRSGQIREVIIESTRTNKMIAKENNLVFIDLSQISREVEKTSDKRPMLSHLAESSSIENDADMVIFPFRPSYYGINENENGEDITKKIELIVAKNRNGFLGSCWAWWYGDTQSIKNEDRFATQFPTHPFGGYNYTEPEDTKVPF